MIRFLWIYAIALRHVSSGVSFGMYWEEKWHPFRLLSLVHLRWLGGRLWGEHYWDLLSAVPSKPEDWK